MILQALLFSPPMSYIEGVVCVRFYSLKLRCRVFIKRIKIWLCTTSALFLMPNLSPYCQSSFLTAHCTPRQQHNIEGGSLGSINLWTSIFHTGSANSVCDRLPRAHKSSSYSNKQEGPSSNHYHKILTGVCLRG